MDQLADKGAYWEHLRERLKACLGEMTFLKGERRWEEIISLFYPLEDKVPEMVQAGLGKELRLEISFALGQMKYFDEAIKECEKFLEEEPDHYHGHSSLGYHLYNSLFAAKNREIILTPESRKERIQDAHKNFRRAQELRPDQVTNYYRQGMLFKSIENKPDQARPCFSTAVQNWDNYSQEQKGYRHQEKKNFIKAIYNLASCQNKTRDYKPALTNMKRCLAEDEATSYLKKEHKYFALAKIYYQLGRYGEALDALEQIIHAVNPKDEDYVFELMARVLLVQGRAEKV